MKKLFLSFGIILSIFAIAVGIFFLVRKEAPQQTAFGSWWWNSKLDAETYLNFAEENKVNEIYYYTRKFDDETKKFISKANAKNIDVFWLAGKYEWLEDNSELITQIDQYVDFQNRNDGAKFSGIHLDIEPHQSPNFKDDRYQLIYNLINLASTLKEKYPSIKFDFDLPFWLHDEINFKGQTKPAYAFMIELANRVFVMSYRDSTEAILDIAKEEIAYAKEQNKQLVLCVETNSSEGDNVSFKEEGKQVMLEEISKLKMEIPNDFGIAIHHIKTWYELN